jgi:uncharacterized protein
MDSKGPGQSLPPAPRAISVRQLILALTTRCNLSCAYCYNGAVEVEPSAEMAPAVVAAALELVARSGEPFDLQLTGGEPTLVPAGIELAARLARATGSCHRVAVQTNATRLTPALIDLFRTHDIRVGVSLDGPPEVHQRQRGRAADTLRGLNLLEAAGIPFRVTAVVTRESAATLDRLALLLAGFAAARGIGLDLLVDKGAAVTGKGVETADPEGLERGLEGMLAVLDMVNARRQIPLRLRERDRLGPVRPQKDRGFCRAATGESLAVDPRGNLFPCGQTLGDPRFAAGTVRQPELGPLHRLSRCRPPDAPCGRCDLEPVCPGDCPSRLHYNGAGRPDLVCTLYRTLWRHRLSSQKGKYAQ